MSLAYQVASALSDNEPTQNGTDGYVCRCPIHGDTNPSLSVKDSTDNNGDPDVVVVCHAGCDWKEVKEELRSRGLIPKWERKQTDQKKTKPNTPEPKEPAKKKRAMKEPNSWIWDSAEWNDDEIKKYLSSRNIHFNDDFPLSRSLKWGSYKDKKTDEMVYQVVAAATNLTDTVVKAIQRLFIDTDDPENYMKDGAKMLGQCQGRGVWFFRKNPKEQLIIGEGIETVLSAMQATGKNGVAALSTSGLINIELSEETKELFILVDEDIKKKGAKKGYAGQVTALKLAERFEKAREGNIAWIIDPSDSCFTDKPIKKDFNDLLQADPTGQSIRDRFDMAQVREEIEWEPPESSGGVAESDGIGEDGYDNYADAPDQTRNALQQMNDGYAAALLGSEFRIIREGFDNEEQKHTLSFMRKNSFNDYFQNKKYPIPAGEGKINYETLSKIWMSWTLRREYMDVGFYPGNTVPDSTYNLFRGFPIEPKPGEWGLFRDHIRDVICSGEEELFLYIMSWIARIIQDPGGDKPGVAVVMQGGKGIGKSFFASMIGKLFGEAYLMLSNSDNFMGKFNMHLSKSLLIFLDEAIWAGDKKAEGKLKAMITEPNILFEPKGIDSISMRSHMNIMIASNEDWVVPATGDERRFIVLKPSSEFVLDTVHFGKIKRQLESGGFEAMMHDFLHYDHSGVNLRLAPHTEGLVEQVQNSLDVSLGFWNHVLDRGYLISNHDTGAPAKADGALPGDDSNWPNMAWKYEVDNEFENYCKKMNERWRTSESLFWTSTWDWWPGGNSGRNQTRKKGGGRASKMKLVSLEEIREAFTAKTGIEFEEDGYIATEFDDQF